MRLFRAELKKIIMIIRNDPRALLAGIIAPSLVLIMFALLFGGLAPMPLGLIDQDEGYWGKRLEAEILGQISPLGNIPYFAKKETDYAKALRAYQKGKLVGIIVIPADFSERFKAGNNPQITYRLNNYNTDFAKNMRLYLQEGIHAFYQKYYKDLHVAVNEVFLAPAQVEWVDIIAVGTLLLAFIIGGMFNYLYVFFKEKQYGTLLTYAIAPQSPLASFAARLVIALVSSILAGLFNALLAYWIIDLNLWDHLLAMGPVLFLTVITYIGAAAVFSIFMNNFFGAVMGAMGGTMIFWFFSGGFTTMVPQQPVLLFIYRIIPNSYALDIIRGRLFGAQNLGTPLNYMVLTAMMLIFLGWAIYLYQTRLWKRPRL